MQKTLVKQILQDSYNIVCTIISEGPRQFVAETFICTSDKGKKYFVKIIPNADFPRKVVKSLVILKELNELGLNNIASIIPTASGDLQIENSDYIFIVFSFIEGKQTQDYDKHYLGKFLAVLETYTSKVKSEVDKETFSSHVDVLFPKYFEKSLEDSNDKIKQELKETLLPYEEELRKDWDTYKQTIQECKALSIDNYVLTHGDAPGNVMVDVHGDLNVIDWDEIMLAPPERDLWFLVGNREFMRGYIEKNRGFQINPEYYKYYLLLRLFDDLYGWMNEILSEKPKEHRQKHLNDLKKDYFEWLRPLVRRL